MENRSRKVPSPSLLISMLALLIAMSGTAVAISKNSIGPKELKRNAVRSKHVKNDQIKSKDVRNNQIRSRDVRDDQLRSKDLKDGRAVTGADVVDDSLTGDDVDESTLEGLGSPTGPAGGDLTGSYPDPAIASDAIGSAEVAPNSLTGSDVNEATLSVVEGKGSITTRAESVNESGGEEAVLGVSDHGELRIGCDGSDGATVNYKNLSGAPGLQERVMLSQDGPVTKNALLFHGTDFSTPASTGSGGASRLGVFATGPGVDSVRYDVWALHDAANHRCVFYTLRYLEP